MAAVNEQWTINGVNLITYARWIETFDGLDSTPDTRGENVPVPNRHGRIWVPKMYDQTKKTIIMYVSDRSPADGSRASTPAARRAQFLNNLRELTTLVGGSRHAPLTVTRTLDNAITMTAQAELGTVIAPSSSGTTDARVAIDLVIPAGFWTDTTTTEVSTGTGIGDGAQLILVGFAPASAPMTDFAFRVIGPATSPKVTDVLTGWSVQYLGSIPSTQQWLLDCTAYASKIAGTVAGWDTSLGTNIIEQTSATGPTLFTLSPNPNGPVVLFNATGTSSTTQLLVKGVRKYLH